jgi:hypothetical protein
MPTHGDSFVDLPHGDSTMSEGLDLSDDCFQLTLEESAQAHSALMVESRGNAQSAHSVVRHSAARKFNQEDPIEAAAAEMILKKN